MRTLLLFYDSYNDVILIKPIRWQQACGSSGGELRKINWPLESSQKPKATSLMLAHSRRRRSWWTTWRIIWRRRSSHQNRTSISSRIRCWEHKAINSNKTREATQNKYVNMSMSSKSDMFMLHYSFMRKFDRHANSDFLWIQLMSQAWSIWLLSRLVDFALWCDLDASPYRIVCGIIIITDWWAFIIIVISISIIDSYKHLDSN